MSGALKLGNLKLPRLGAAGILSGAGNAGPRRLAMLTVSVLVIGGLVVAIATGGRRAPPVSQDTRMGTVDPLPGGLHSTPEQDALARTAEEAHAKAALGQGVSYTPQMAPSVPVKGPIPHAEGPAPEQTNPQRPRFVVRPASTPTRSPVVLPVAFPTPVGEAQPAVQPVQATVVDPKAEAAYSKEIGDLFSQWGGRMPQTDIVLPASDQDNDGQGTSNMRGLAGNARTAPMATPAASRAADPGTILIPAGRGVFAHPVLAVNSDASSPVVMQADSGPIAGDRMIGSFAKENKRLVIHINTVIHDGKSIGTDGVVIAPDTMEAAVASNVDEHYLERFILPAAAAFVQGLGQALATTSNTVAVLSPLGGATTSTHLNLNQQLGVAAGVSAGQIGNVLNQEAPKGPTVSLDANVAVGVMFLSPVILHSN
jgi:intracellular multiplication protein IcmE